MIAEPTILERVLIGCGIVLATTTTLAAAALFARLVAGLWGWTP